MKREYAFVAVLAAVVGLVGCSGPDAPVLGGGTGSAGGFSLAGVTGYGSANAIVTTGYSDKEIAPDHVEVRVKGSPVTPPARLEKIALARASEIATDRKYKYFKTGGFAHAYSCKDAKEISSKSGKTPAEQAPVVAVDVIFANQAADAGFLPASETFTRLSAELAAETVSAEDKAAALAAAKAQCGK